MTRMSTGSSPTHTVSEWQTLFIPGLRLDRDDQALADSLRDQRRVLVDELRDGLRIGARSWVGVVRFRGFELHVLPKLAGDNLGLVELVDYVTGIDTLSRIGTRNRQSIGAEGTSLLDLIALLLAEACERLLRGGLLSDYSECENDLPVLRGRLLGDRQLIRRQGRIDRLECRYDEYVGDILENQVLLGALSLCSRVVTHPAVALRVRRLQKLFIEICSATGLDFRHARQEICYHRLNEVYREPHALAWLVADGLGVTSLFEGTSARCFCFLLNMNRLFELFLSKWLGWVLSGDPVRVRTQRSDRSIIWDVNAKSPYRRVIPDILLERKGDRRLRLPIDAKYKLYDEAKVSSSDIYQTFLYSFAYGPPEAQARAAVLVYPSASKAPKMARLHIRSQAGTAGAEILVIGVHIVSALREARSSLLGSQAPAMREALMRRLAGRGQP